LIERLPRQHPKKCGASSLPRYFAQSITIFNLRISRPVAPRAQARDNPDATFCRIGWLWCCPRPSPGQLTHFHSAKDKCSIHAPRIQDNFFSFRTTK